MLHPADTWNLVTHMTLRRLINGLKLVVSYLFSRLSRKPVHFGMPSSIAVEPTTSCNLRCPECPSGLRSFTRPTGMLSTDLFKKVIDEIYRETFYLTFYFQGEPYLHPHFLDLVGYAKSKKIYTATSTNGHYLSDERAEQTVRSGLDRLIISIDGTTQETYASYRVGGSLEKVLEGAENIVRWKRKLNSSTPHIIFQFLVVRPNEHQVEEVFTIADRIGVDEVRLKTAQIYDFEDGSDLIPTEDRYSRYRQLPGGKWEIKNKLLDHCWKMWHSCVITWDGSVVPCCFDKDASHALGKYGDQTFTSIWKSDEYKRFRSTLMAGRENIDICKNCSEGTAIWA